MMNKLYTFIVQNFFHQSNRLESLEGIRAWAVLMVFNTHFFLRYLKESYGFEEYPILVRYFQFLQQGHCGVDLFFMLSGFLIFSALRKPNTVFGFLSKRYERLFPLILITNMSFFLEGVSYKNLIDNLFYLKIFSESTYLNWVTWSLNYEIYFYISAAILGIIFKKYFLKNYGAFILIILAIYVFTFLKINVVDIRYSSFFIGMIIGKIFYEDWEKAKIYFKNLLIPSVLAVWSMRFMLGGEEVGYQAWQYIILQIGFAGIILSVLAENPIGKVIFSFKPLRFIGNISFSFYMIHGIWGLTLSHYFTNILTNNQINSLKVSSHYILGLIITTFLAAFTYFYLEKPYFHKK